MAENLDVDETLREYGYGKSKGMAGYIVLSLLLLLSCGGATYLGKLWTEEKAKSLESEQIFKTLSLRLSDVETRNSELSALLADKQSELERVRMEWTTQVDEMEASHKEQLQRAFAQMNEIVYDSKTTLSYINDVETRLRSGQKMDLEEAKKLAGIVNGLSFLHEQYNKPIAEFRELDTYFQKQLKLIPQGTTALATPVGNNRRDPAQTTNVIEKIFKNRQYKAEREAYLEDKGRAEGMAEGRATGLQDGKREALTQAQIAVQQAYDRAQTQMRALSLDKNKFLAQLDQLVESNIESVDEVEAFFQKSKEILKIHDEIMSIEPTQEMTPLEDLRE